MSSYTQGVRRALLVGVNTGLSCVKNILRVSRLYIVRALFFWKIIIMNKPAYIESLTPMRAIAAMWVMLFHIDVSIFYRDLGALVSRDMTGIFSKGYLWVDFFFLLSGFIIAHVYGEKLSSPPTVAGKWQATKHYLWARFSRLYPLHLFTLCLLILFAGIVPEFFPQVMDGSWDIFFAWSVLDSHFLFTNAMGQHPLLSWNIVSWSIGAEWWTYVFAIIFIVALCKRKLTTVAASMLLALAALIALVLWLPEKNLDITHNYGFVRCFFEFVIGLGIYECYRRQMAQNWLKFDGVFVVLMLLIAAIFHWRAFDVVIIPVFALLILAVSYNKTRVHDFLNKPALQYLGDISYSIYLMHGVWFMVFWFAWPSIKLATGMAELPLIVKLLYILLFFGLTLLSAHFSYRYVEVAGREWLRKFYR